VVFLDVGQGDATLIYNESGAVLVDAGPPGSGIVDSLEQRGVRRVQHFFISHGHRDHYGGWCFAENPLPVDTLWIPPDDSPSKEYSGCVQKILAQGAFLKELRGDTSLVVQGLQVRVHGPDKRFTQSGNESSLVMTLWRSGTSGNIVLTGDAGTTELEAIAWSEPLRSHGVLKVPHHGSKNSAAKIFMGTVLPAMAVVSASANNQYGHPSPEMLELLYTVLPDSSALWVTAQCSSAVLYWDHTGLYPLNNCMQSIKHEGDSRED
jgi:competence protein ComEC